MSKRYDALVVGSGTAGQTAAYQLNRNGFSVGLVEHSDRPGGTCALSGCQAKKWFYEGTEAVARSRHLSGIGITSPAIADWSALRDAKNRFTASVPSKTVSGLKKAGIDFIPGQARFTGPQSVAVGREELTARFIVLAVGAVPMSLPIDGSDHIISSSEFMELDRLPSRIVFIGGGFISFEFAHFAARLGPSDIHCIILEVASRPLGPFDEQMVALLSAASAEAGIDIHTNVGILGIEKTDRAFRITTEGGRRFEADLVVHGAGRAPNIDALELDSAGIEATKRGITVNEKMATSNPYVYAVGDCADTLQLARVADAEAETAANNIVSLSNGDNPGAVMDYSAVPTVLFTYPQYGMVGATEDALKKEGASYEKSCEDHLDWPTYTRVGIAHAAYKVLAGEDGKILGAHILSDNAAGLINAFSLAMHNGLSAETLYRQSIMTPYPSRESDIIYMLRPLVF
ncbi:dihydrolipoyl dehydrogenase family protein [Desulfococcus multivorans]|uniref:Pyridine nucleotide-disulfide oxidoreductase, FAD/NAD(P)-binding domain containing protein n=3 Tax=Desulfococcus TaxID=896 RepID=S7VDD8_DESML|nr:NAD(P)/FAD-dependent oxidoreductase [Desulfococcus multivorans]AOY58263.1 putative FAD-dependent pyridine nucleotide-disulfide oxidoreductase [Desulfococcus multivorans]AQV00607.1 pyridine nucleotide-disulfide oxidoreductase [Desulfococcus multivorans]EPR42483.1 Pyridine nucleotide-disulfide oxidoreductase, FAD/NAD(P)-binding domain containing protein [Desulfococcus multivorans DSM 2059]MDX9818453.1 NAD(P)/FAD-dependent oxidoreductase [Desulfococcus multivorans]SJZ97735.1 glutathione reduct